MKRIAIKLVVLLLLGAVLNVAVAWGCAVAIDTPDWDLPRQALSFWGDGKDVWIVKVQGAAGVTVVTTHPCHQHFLLFNHPLSAVVSAVHHPPSHPQATWPVCSMWLRPAAR